MSQPQRLQPLLPTTASSRRAHAVALVLLPPCPGTRRRPIALLSFGMTLPAVLPSLLFGSAVLLFLQVLAPAEPAPAAQMQFYHNFRGQPLPPELTLFQVEDDRFAQPGPEGLRITLPGTYRHRANGVGCRTSLVIRGDFDVTAAFEILDVERPAAGQGAGVGLALDRPAGGVQLRRQVGPKGNHSLFAIKLSPVPEKKSPEMKQKWGGRCDERVLRLRLQRVGSTVHYLWAPGLAEEEFKEIDQVEFDNEDLQHVRLFAFNNQNPCLVDVRFIDMRIRSGAAMPAEVPAAAAAPPPGRHWLLLVLILVGMLLLAVGIWLPRRFSRSQSKPSAWPAPDADPDD